jgi:SRSO17 transposase
MVEHDAGSPQRLNDFMSLFGDAFRRRDQARWAAVYLQGLLTAEGRKTINRLARRVVLPPELTVEDAAQALQNFVNQSPWDEQTIWRRYRILLAERFAELDGAFVLDDLTFVKQGRHSVGVQRQYSSALGRKTNCQIAVALHHAGATGCHPLGLRLYLPRAWLQQPQRLDAAGVPQESRLAGGKGAIALDLLDEARKDGWPARRVLGGAGFAVDRDFRESLNSRGLVYLLDAPAGLERLEGERFQLAEEDRGWISNCAGDADAMVWQPQQTQRAANEVEAHLMSGLGLDHFEGRSWRGFHHHACLVMLAFAFRLLHGCHGDCPPAETVAVGV